MMCRFLFLKILKTKSEGFTLIELMVVFIIIGVLAVAGLPSFLRQVGKARESEIKNAVGTVARSQLSYHWEKQIFCCGDGATDQQILEAIGASIPSKYITSWTFDTSNLSNQVRFQPNNNNWANDGTRGFSGGSFFSVSSPNAYQIIMCQNYEPSETADFPVLTDPECGSNAEQIR